MSTLDLLNSLQIPASSPKTEETSILNSDLISNFTPKTPDINPTVIAALRQGNKVTSDQLKVLTPDEYNYHFNHDAFENTYGAGVTQAIENQIQATTDYRNGFLTDDRSIPRKLGDIALGVGQGAAQGILGTAADRKSVV